jgi:hypothetical protein
VDRLEIESVAEGWMDDVDAERLLHDADFFILGLQNAFTVLLALDEVLDEQFSELLNLVDLLLVLVFLTLEVVDSRVQIVEHALAVVEYSPPLVCLLHQSLVFFRKRSLDVCCDLLQRGQNLDLNHEHGESE